jgi:hypothetical protein
VNVAGTPSIVMPATFSPRKSSENEDRFCVAVIVMSVCVPGSIVFVAGSYLIVRS